MKKGIIGLLAMLVMVTSLPVSAQAAGVLPKEAVSAITLSAETEYTTAVKTSKAALVYKAYDLINDGQALSALPGGAVELARLALENRGNAGPEYILYTDSAGAYAQGEGRVKKIDLAEFYSLVSQTPGFYQYRDIPQARLPGSDSPAAVLDSAYAFRKLDGVFYRTQFSADEAVPVIAAAGSGIPLPVFSQKPSSATVTLIAGGTRLFSGTLAQAKDYALPDSGAMQVKIAAVYGGDWYKGTVTYGYNLNGEEAFSSGVTFSVEGASTYPGEVVVLRAKGLSQRDTVTFASDVDFTPKFYSDGEGGRIALLPVSYFTAPGEHYVTLSAGGNTQKFGITANGKDFQIQHLTVGASTTAQTIASQKANDEFNEKLLPLRWDDDAQARWDGRFLLPVSGARVTTQFGAVRYTNGSSEASRHGGVDLAVATGTRVSATNNGRVVFAGYLQLTGYTVLVEHGYGLKSWHYHMNSIAVKTGDTVVKGQKIGEVGTTGFSTGPHLHFAMSVNNVFINPYTLINTDLLA